MIKLNSARKLQAILAGAVATTQPAAAVGYNDKTATTFDGDSELHDLNGTTAVDICPAPASGAIRHIDYVTLRNYDSAAVTVTMRVNEGGTVHNLIQATLLTGEMLGYTHAAGWYVNTADGSRKSGSVQDFSSYQATSGKDASGGYVGLTGFAVNFKNLLGTIVSLVSNSATAIRTYTFPDKSITVAGLDDIITAHSGLSGIGTNTHAQIDTALTRLANTSGTNTGDQDLSSYAPLASPALTGAPTVPTAAAATNTTQAASTAFVQAAVAAAVSGLLNFKGTTDCSANPNYPAATKGDAYIVSVAGKIGGASGTAVDVGDWYVATATNVGGTEAAVGASWGHMEHNLVGALLASNNLSDLANAATARTNLGLVIGTNVQAHMAALDAVVGTNTGDETGARIAALHHAASAKTVLVDADEVTGGDSASSFSLIRTAWSDVRTYLASKAWTWLAAHIFSDQIVSRAMLMDCGLTVGNVKGSAGGAQTFDYPAGSVGSITLNATTTILITNFPPTGNRGILAVKITAAGSFTLNVPTTNWRNPDGSTTTTLSTYLTNAGITLGAGMNEFVWWSDDAGATLYGLVK